MEKSKIFKYGKTSTWPLAFRTDENVTFINAATRLLRLENERLKKDKDKAWDEAFHTEHRNIELKQKIKELTEALETAKGYMKVLNTNRYWRDMEKIKNALGADCFGSDKVDMTAWNKAKRKR